MTKPEPLNKQRVFTFLRRDVAFFASKISVLRARLGRPQSQEQPREVSVLAEEGQHADILFFLIVLLMYIQALEVRVLKDACFLLLISLKPNVGRKRNEQCVPHCQFIKRDRQFLKRALALANKRQTSVHKSCSEQTINQDLENNTEEHFYKPQSLYELWDSDEHLRACLRLL